MQGPSEVYAKRTGPGVVIARLDIDVQRGEMADGAGKTMTTGRIQGLRRWRFPSLSGPERQRLFVVLALLGRSGRTS